jgi:hypothetical protein
MSNNKLKIELHGFTIMQLVDGRYKVSDNDKVLSIEFITHDLQHAINFVKGMHYVHQVKI